MFFRGIIIALIYVVVGFFSMVVMTKLAKSPLSIKTLLARFGGLIVPFTMLNGLVMILALLNVGVKTAILLFAGLFFLTVVIPVTLTFASTDHIQRVYFTLGAGIAATILMFFVINQYFDSGNMMEVLEHLD